MRWTASAPTEPPTSAGLFDVDGDYSCTTGYSQGADTTSGGVTLPGDEQVYLYVAGGNPGLNTGDNDSIGLMAALGPCNAQFSAFLEVNEITTVAAAYALAGFATDATHVSSSGSPLALKGLANAGLNSVNLANVFNGTAESYGAYTIAPSYNTIMIANILAACVNGATANSSCYTLFQNTQTEGTSGTKATDTATAAIHLAHNPYPSADGVTALYGLISGTPAFAGGLSVEPNDFTLGINIQNSNCFNNSAYGLAIDAAGSAWALGGTGVCKFSSNGVPLTSYYGFDHGGCFGGGQNLAIDNSGNVWIPARAYSRLCKISNSGTAISSSSGYTGGGISTPFDVAIDASGNVWLANATGSLSKFSSSGAPLSGSNGYTDGGSNDAYYGVAIDTGGHAWAANYGNSSVSEFSSTGVALSPTTGYYKGGLENPYDVAIDASGNVWAPNYNSDSVSELDSSGNALSPNRGPYGDGGFVGDGVDSPISIAIDSKGDVWTANFNGDSVTPFTSSGIGLSGDPGYTGSGTVYGPVSVALDGSGDVWVTNYDGTLTELIGASSPVVTPIAANLVAPYGSAAVNRP